MKKEKLKKYGEIIPPKTKQDYENDRIIEENFTEELREKIWNRIIKKKLSNEKSN